MYRVFSKQGAHNRKVKLDDDIEFDIFPVSYYNLTSDVIIKLYSCRKKARRDRAYWLYKRGEMERLRKYYRSYYKQFTKRKSRRRHRKRGRRPAERSTDYLINY